MAEILRPPGLKSGQTILIVAPAGPPDPDILDQGVRFFKEAGFRVRFGEHLFSRHGCFAGDDSQRISDFNQALNDPDVRCILCARGGYGTARILDQLDYDAVDRDPKIIIGYSDITALLAAFQTKTGLVTFHGPMPGTRSVMSSWSFRNLLNQITTPSIPFSWPAAPTFPKIISLKPGISEGRVFGGCLSILTTLTGTRFLPDLTDTILFIEEVGEAPYMIDRSLTHLRNAGWFEQIKGILFGQFTACTPRGKDQEPSLSIDEIIEEIFRDYTIPIVMNIPAGHGTSTFTIPMGLSVRIENNHVIQLEAGTSV